jgi:hypothetical protein
MKSAVLIELYKYGKRNFAGANLAGANLVGANLAWANLEGADLRGADLACANLGGADLEGADLRGADLYRASLAWANLKGADLRGTYLDPTNTPNGDVDGFELIDNGQWCVGYRTKHSPHMSGQELYQVGQLREAPVFSTCPTIKEALDWGSPLVKVIFRPWECHHANDKHRVTWFIVWEDIKNENNN